MNCRHLGDLEMRDAITRFWTIECQGKEFFYKFHKVHKFDRPYCKEKVGKWKEEGKKLQDGLSKATMELQQDHLNEKTQRRLHKNQLKH